MIFKIKKYGITGLVSILILLCTLTGIHAKAQLFQRNHGYNTVFVNDANIRQKPSIYSKVIGTLPHNSIVNPYDDYDNILKDTINGRIGYWKAIKFNNLIGYMWETTFCEAKFKSYTKTDNTIIVGFSSSKVVGFKIFNDNIFTYEVSFHRPKMSSINAVETIGKTFNSKGKEIIVVKYGDNSYELFELDSNGIKPSNINLRDDSYITNKYFEFEDCIISRNNVNIRSNASIDSSVVKVLPLHTRVKLIQKDYKREKLNGKVGSWHKIEFNGEIAYVWDNLLSIPIKYIKSNLNNKLSFLLSTGTIYAFIDGQIVDQISYDYYPRGADIYEKGIIGLEGKPHFVTIDIKAYTEGHDCGEVIYYWDGKKISYLGWNGGSGDINYESSNLLIFPNSLGGIKNRIIESNYECEDVSSNVMNEREFLFFNKEVKILEFNDGGFIEVPSKHLYLRSLVNSNYPEHKLVHYKFSDINNDGIEDAVCFILKHGTHYSNNPTEPIIAIVFGDKDGNFSIHSINNSIIKSQFSGVTFKINKSKIIVKVFYNVGYNSDSQFEQKLYEYTFQYSNDNKFYWYSKIEAKAKKYESHDIEWNSKKSYFKTSKIKFEDAW